jgi:integrating conjugative element protein (TIGR03752 family)
MKSNRLLKWLMVLFIGVVLVVGLKLISSGTSEMGHQRDPADTLTPEEMRSLGIEGDTPRDTVATLVAQVKQLRTELQTALGDNKGQKEDDERLRQREQSIDQRIQTALDSERARLQQERNAVASEQQQTQGLLQDLQRRLDGLGQSSGNIDLPIGLGLRDGDGDAFVRDEVRWVEPEDAKPNERTSSSTSDKGFSFPTQFRSAVDATANTVADSAESLTGVSTAKAVYTVPANATLMGSVAMTALIGRVPVDGTVNDPYPFKVLIGPDNLTANGIDLPDVAGAVVSGTASGDWTLSCVRGQIRSITFVFEDGTIRTLPEDNGNTQRSENNDAIQGGLGWISDPYGIPCVSGERRSNAQQYLGSQALITAAGAGAASLLQGNNSVSYMSPGNPLGTVGITTNEALGRVLSGGVQEMSQWVNKLYGQAFAAVYVEPGAKVAVHIEQPLTLDYDAKGRRVEHSVGGRHVVSDLD